MKGIYSVIVENSSSPIFIDRGIYIHKSNHNNTLYAGDSEAFYKLEFMNSKWEKTILIKEPSLSKLSPSEKAIAYVKPKGIFCRLVSEDNEIFITNMSLVFYWVKAKK